MFNKIDFCKYNLKEIKMRYDNLSNYINSFPSYFLNEVLNKLKKILENNVFLFKSSINHFFEKINEKDFENVIKTNKSIKQLFEFQKDNKYLIKIKNMSFYSMINFLKKYKELTNFFVQLTVFYISMEKNLFFLLKILNFMSNILIHIKSEYLQKNF